MERVSNLYLIKSKNINQTDYVLTDSGDADTEDNLCNGLLSNLETDDKDEEKYLRYK